MTRNEECRAEEMGEKKELDITDIITDIETPVLFTDGKGQIVTVGTAYFMRDLVHLLEMEK